MGARSFSGLRRRNVEAARFCVQISTKGTYDSAMWGMMGRKGRFIEQFFRGDPNLRDLEDLGEASQYEQASAIATSDERVIQLTEMKHALDKAERSQAAHQREQYSMRSKLAWKRDEIANIDDEIPVVQADLAERTPTAGDAFTMKVGKSTTTERKAAGEALDAFYKEFEPSVERGKAKTTKVGELGGFDMRLYVEKPAATTRTNTGYFLVRSNGKPLSLGGFTGLGVIRSAEDRLSKFEDTISYLDRQKAQAEMAVTSLQGQIGKPFEGAADIDKLRGEIRELERQLQPVKPPAPAAQGTGTTGPAPQHQRGEQLKAPEHADTGALTGEHLGDMTPGEERLVDEVGKILKRIAPEAETLSMRSMQAGRYTVHGVNFQRGLKRVIAWALEAPNVVGTARHEAVHFLKSQGFIRPKEWAALEDAARKGNWIKKHNIEERYPDHSEEAKLEEAVAEQFGKGRPWDDMPGFIRRIFDRIAQALRQIAAAVRRIMGKDATAADIFAKMESGEMGRSAPGEAGGEATRVPTGQEEDSGREARAYPRTNAKPTPHAQARGRRADQPHPWGRRERSRGQTLRSSRPHLPRQRQGTGRATETWPHPHGGRHAAGQGAGQGLRQPHARGALQWRQTR